MFNIFVGLIVVAVAYFHYTQGFFSATISAILCIFAAVFSLSYHEKIIETFLAPYATESMHSAVMLVLFAAIYLSLRMVFDKVVPGDVSFPAAYSKLGGGLMGLVAGVAAAGLAAVAAQAMPFDPPVLGFAHIRVEEDKEAVMPTEQGQQQHYQKIYNQLGTAEPLSSEAAQGDKQSAMPPADEILVDMVKNLSERGALAANPPLSAIHPDWLTELMGQRLGTQTAGGRIAVNTSGRSDLIATAAGTPFADAGVYLLDRQIIGKKHDYDGVSRAVVENPFPKADLKSDPEALIKNPKGITIIVRAFFGRGAKDTRDGLIRFSMSSFRLVTQRFNVVGDEIWSDYYPIGTIDNANTFYRSTPDDYLFINAEGKDGGSSPAIDLVFQIEPKGFLENAQDPRTSKITDGTFLEFKRMARVDLSGQALRPMAEYKKSPNVEMLRKKLPEKKGGGTDGSGGCNGCGPAAAPAKKAAPPAAAPAGGAAPAAQPAPTGGAAGAAVAPAAAADTSFAVSEVLEQRKFYATVRVPPGSAGDVQVPGGTVALEEGAIRAIKLGPVAIEKLNEGTGEAVNRLVVPAGKKMITVEAAPGGGDGWTWKDRLGEIGLVDTANARAPLIGVWVIFGANQIVARFSPDGNISLADFTPSGPPTKIVFAFVVPQDQKATMVAVGNAAVKTFNPPAP